MKLSEALRIGAEKVGWRQCVGQVYVDENGLPTDQENAYKACAVGCIMLGGFQESVIAFGFELAVKNDIGWSLTKIAKWLEEQGE